MADPSGFWKFTAIIRAGDRGKSTSVVWSGLKDLDKALVKAKAWAKVYSPLLGQYSKKGDPPHLGTADSPQIQYLRITDALNPRVGQLFNVKADLFVGPGGFDTQDNSADTMTTALALRLACTTIANPIKTVWSNHGFVGIPDAVVRDGDVPFLNFIVGTSHFGTYLKAYLQYITAASNGLGCMTTDEMNQPKKHTGVWKETDGVWFANLVAHGYVNGDRIRVTGANAPGFNGTYIVTGVKPTTPDDFAIVGGPKPDAAAPKHATVQRVQLASGVRPLVFAGFQAPFGGWIEPYGVKVSDRRKAKPYSEVSFRPKPKRLR